jgi:hypothetical protein
MSELSSPPITLAVLGLYNAYELTQNTVPFTTRTLPHLTTSSVGRLWRPTCLPLLLFFYTFYLGDCWEWGLGQGKDTVLEDLQQELPVPMSKLTAVTSHNCPSLIISSPRYRSTSLYHGIQMINVS